MVLNPISQPHSNELCKMLREASYKKSNQTAQVPKTKSRTNLELLEETFVFQKHRNPSFFFVKARHINRNITAHYLPFHTLFVVLSTSFI